MSVSNRDNARDLLETADARAGDPMAESYSATTAALIGIGYSVLDLADAIREQSAKQIPLADVEAALMRVAAASDGAPEHA